MSHAVIRFDRNGQPSLTVTQRRVLQAVDDGTLDDLARARSGQGIWGVAHLLAEAGLAQRPSIERRWRATDTGQAVLARPPRTLTLVASGSDAWRGALTWRVTKNHTLRRDANGASLPDLNRGAFSAYDLLVVRGGHDAVLNLEVRGWLAESALPFEGVRIDTISDFDRTNELDRALLQLSVMLLTPQHLRGSSKASS